MRVRTAIALVAIVVMPANTTAKESTPPFPAADARAFLDAGPLQLRETPNNRSRVTFVEMHGRSFAYAHERSRLFPVRARVPIRVSDVRWTSTGMLRVRFENERLGSGGVLLASLTGVPFSSADVQAMLQRVFARANDPEPSRGFVGNRRSHIVHTAGCNHLPSESDFVSFGTLDEAVSAGYRQCPACFARIPPVQDYETERALGLDASNQLRIRYPLSPDDSRQRRLDAIGRTSLDHWLQPLRGYTYHFYAVESDELNAFACPTGYVYVTTALMDATESDAELEAVLAHEIAHVELRHGYREFRHAQDVGLWASLLGTVGVVVAQSKIRSPELVEDVGRLLMIMGTLAAQIAISGYSREHEAEADAYAAAYLASRGDGPAALMAVLSKMRYSGIASGQELVSTSSLFDSHPNLDARISTARNAAYAVFDSAETFDALDDAGNVVATLRFTCQSVVSKYRARWAETKGAGNGWGGITGAGEEWNDTENVLSSLQPDKTGVEYRAFAAFSVASDARRPLRLGSIVVHDGGEKLFLENSENPLVRQGEECGISLTILGRDAIAGRTVDAIEAPDALGVKQWVHRR